MTRKRKQTSTFRRSANKGIERRDAVRSPAATVAIIPEGQNEANYFGNLAKHARAPGVLVDDVRGVPAMLMDRAISIQQRNRRLLERGELPEFDHVWCVFDGGDNHPNVPEVIRTGRRFNVRVAISNPSFEVWLILHLRALTTRPLSSDFAKKVLRDNYHPGYGRSTGILPFDVVERGISEAILRAKELEKHHRSHGGEKNPSSEVYKLVQQILRNSATRRLPN